MGNLGNILIKLAALAGGAALGLIASRIYDEAMIRHAEERSQNDKDRYAQGLAPLSDQQK